MKLGAWDTNTVVCTDVLTLLKGLPDASVNCVVTSPPYNLGTHLNGAHPTSRSLSNWSGSKLLKGGYGDFKDAMPQAEYIDWQRAILNECCRVIRHDGCLFYNQKWRIQGGLLDMKAEITEGFPVRQVIIWNRGSTHMHNPSFFPPQYEPVYLIAHAGFKRTSYADAYGDVWDIAPEHGNDHPAPFPELLVERCLLSASVVGDVVLDPFGGSGTTAAVAQRMGRQFLTCDISAEYCDLMRRRLALPYTQPMFTEARL